MVIDRLIVVAALLLVGLTTGVVAAAEDPEHPSNQSKNARKVVIMLASMGINDPEIAEFVGYVDRQIDHGRLKIAEEHVAGGKLSFTYRVDPKIHHKNFEIKFTPDDSNFEAVASTDGIMLNYRLQF